MASTITSTRLTSQANAQKKYDPVIKKRSAIPTRSAFGDLQNKNVPAATNSNLKAGLQRQKGTTALRKPMTKKVAALPQNKALTKNVTSVIAPLPATKKEVAPVQEQTNIFELKAFNVHNIDEDDSENPQLCTEFVNDIYQYMLYLEAEYPIRRQYLEGSGIKPKMRCILVDWLIQVHHRFQLLQETLYLTIAILDRFLQIHPVPRVKLQLAGVTAMLLACKYEEMYAPEIADYVYITDEAFSKSQIISMEILMLKVLDFNLGRPLPLHFLRRNSKAGEVDATQHSLAKYLMELALVDYEMCHLPPSKVAAGALCLSIDLLGGNEWSSTLQHYSHYSKETLFPVVCHLAKNLQSARTSSFQKAIKTKYNSQKLLRISQVEEVKSEKVTQYAEKADDYTL